MKINNKKKHAAVITQRFLAAMDRITGNRSKGKITAAAFGKVVGITSSNLTRLRNKTNENFVTLEAVARICEAYKISPAWLITGKGEMYESKAEQSASLEMRLKKLEKSYRQIEDRLQELVPVDSV